MAKRRMAASQLKKLLDAMYENWGVDSRTGLAALIIDGVQMCEAIEVQLPPDAPVRLHAKEFRSQFRRLFASEPTGGMNEVLDAGGDLMAVCDLCNGRKIVESQAWVQWRNQSENKPGETIPPPNEPLKARCGKCKGIGVVLLEAGLLLAKCIHRTEIEPYE